MKSLVINAVLIILANINLTAQKKCLYGKETFKINTVKLTPADFGLSAKCFDNGCCDVYSVLANEIPYSTGDTILANLRTLGGYRPNYQKGIYESKPLLGYFSSTTDIPILDSIEITFFMNPGFDLVENNIPSLKKDTAYVNWKKRIVKANGIRAKKDAFFSDSNPNYLIFQDYLKNSKLEITPKHINGTKDFSSKEVLKVKQDLALKINKIKNLPIGVKQQVGYNLEKLIKNNIQYEVVGYFAVYSPDYLTLFNSIVNSQSRIDIDKNLFNTSLFNYFNIRLSAMNHGAFFTIEKVVVKSQLQLSDSIYASLTANMQLQDEQQKEILNLSVEVMYSISRTIEEAKISTSTSLKLYRFFTALTSEPERPDPKIFYKNNKPIEKWSYVETED